MLAGCGLALLVAARAEGARVLLRLESPGEAIDEAWFVRVEGKWVPEAQHASWKSRVARLEARCAALPSTGKLAGWASTLASAAPGLKQLAGAETQASFDAGMVSVAQAVGPQLAQMLLDRMLGSTSGGGIRLNVGSILYSAPQHDSDVSTSGPPQGP